MQLYQFIIIALVASSIVFIFLVKKLLKPTKVNNDRTQSNEIKTERSGAKILLIWGIYIIVLALLLCVNFVSIYSNVSNNLDTDTDNNNSVYISIKGSDSTFTYSNRPNHFNTIDVEIIILGIGPIVLLIYGLYNILLYHITKDDKIEATDNGIIIIFRKTYITTNYTDIVKCQAGGFRNAQYISIYLKNRERPIRINYVLNASELTQYINDRIPK